MGIEPTSNTDLSNPFVLSLIGVMDGQQSKCDVGAGTYSLYIDF